MFHSRQTYNFFDLLSDLGGVMEVIMLIASVMIIPISEHAFVVRAITKMYYAKSKEDVFFDKTGK